VRTGGRGKYNSNFGGAFRKAKYEKLRRRKKKRRKRGRAKIPSPQPLPFCPPERPTSEASRSFRILFKMSSDFFQQTPPKLISCLARRFAPRFGGHFRKEMPRVFEINRQFSRRKAAVHKFKNLYCGFAAMSRRFSSAFGEIQNEILINCRCKALPFYNIKNF
jgi:hypothetical protein